MIRQKIRASFTFKKILFERLATLLVAHVSIIEALHVIASTLSKKDSPILLHVIADVEQGIPFHHAFARVRGFSKEELSIIQTGEMTGELAKNLSVLASLLDSQQVLKRKVIGALIYPSVILCMGFGVLTAIAVFILPAIIPVITSLQTDIPTSTRILIFTYAFTKEYWFVIVGTGLLIVITGIFVGLHSYTRKRVLSFLVSLPIIRSFHKTQTFERFFETTASLMRAGIPMEQSLEIATHNVAHAPYKTLLEKMIEELKAGQSFFNSLERTHLFTPDVLQLIHIGERTGRIEEMLRVCAQDHRECIDRFYKRLTEMIGPMTMIFLGLFVGYIALSIITPIYSAAQHVYK